MQPRESFVIDITKPEEQLLAEMKSKTRYNLNLAKKKGVRIINVSQGCHPEFISGSNEISNEIPKQVRDDNDRLIGEFTRLTEVMAKRNGIISHEADYYRKMFEVLPGDMLRLYLAEYEGKIICANLVVFYGQTCTYLHGASDDDYRNVMAPYLLQWQQILDAKAAGCEKYDFGGISTNYESRTNIRITNKWSGITRFKLGFSPATKPIVFPGSYDIVLRRDKYLIYRFFTRLMPVLKMFKK
jgi:lipid II:glycine glycyltransferase (peptidoglycan interpeptide bridge formation enzyme)